MPVNKASCRESVAHRTTESAKARKADSVISEAPGSRPISRRARAPRLAPAVLIARVLRVRRGHVRSISGGLGDFGLSLGAAARPQRGLAITPLRPSCLG